VVPRRRPETPDDHRHVYRSRHSVCP
jgi:hypothetical protein